MASFSRSGRSSSSSNDDLQSRDFQSNFDSTASAVNTGATTISVGIIVVIVVVCIGSIGALILGVCMYQRQQRRREERKNMLQPGWNSTGAYANNNSNNDQNAVAINNYAQGPAAPYQTQQYTGVTNTTNSYEAHGSSRSEVHGSVVSPRYEVANTEYKHRELPDTESRQEKSPFENGPRAELGGHAM